jgi:hypothetical protein
MGVWSFHVKQYECLARKEIHGILQRRKSSHTIPKDGRPPKPRAINTRRRVLSYLMRNEYVSDEQMLRLETRKE